MQFLEFLQTIHNPILDFIFYNITFIANSALIIALFAIIYWCFDKKIIKKVAYSFIISGSIVQITKLFMRIPRPWIRDNNLLVNDAVKKTASGYSFPSGHSQSTSSICNSIATNIKAKSWRILLFIFPFLMMFSRMYCLVHTPLDVCVAYLIGLAIVLLVNYLSEKHENILIILTLILAIAQIIYVGYLNKNYLVDFKDLNDSATMAGVAFGFGLAMILDITKIKYQTIKNNRIIFSIIGLVSIVILKVLLGKITNNNLYLIAIEYSFIMLYIFAIYPLTIQRITSLIFKKEKK